MRMVFQSKQRKFDTAQERFAVKQLIACYVLLQDVRNVEATVLLSSQTLLSELTHI